MSSHRRSRRVLSLVGTAAVAVGVAAKLAVPGLAGDLLGSACYTGLVFVMAAVAWPRWAGVALAGAAFGVSAGVEFLQLTGVPDAAAAVVPLSRWVLGSTFTASDFAGYAAGAAAALALDGFSRRGRPRSPAPAR